MDDSRELMFGVLAMELAYIDGERLSQLCATWPSQEGVRFSDWMISQGVITTEEGAEIERFLLRRLAAHGGDAGRLLASAMTMEARDAILNADADSLRKTLSFAVPHADFSQIGPANPNLEPRTKYTRTRVHGQGGLGRVWLARDNHLHRSVALKEILAGKSARREELGRFVQEAQITSQLEHPNIVPVYELAMDETEGAAYYTMRFVRGRTLKEEIDDYHRRRRSGEAGPLELRQLLQAFVSICQALAFAHSRGVIHRDLKPANVMIGSFGEVVVLDWGLAKLVDAVEPVDKAAESFVPSTDRDGFEATGDGLVLGTLAFMSPEQAAGAGKLVGRQTDIYGLGAILFAILTGNPPHKGGSTHELRAKIVNAPTPLPRRVESSVPAPLDAICGKAMHREIPNRYASARELAEDIQRWLADEPVSVHRDEWTVRLVRWTRRHRSGAVALGASLLAISIVASVAAFVMDRARRSENRALVAERVARIAERSAKDEAAKRLRDARGVLDTALTQMSRELLNYPGVQQLRKTLLERAAADYERFAAERSDDRELQLESARAWLRLSEVHELLGNHDRASNACVSAERLIKGQPDWSTIPEVGLLAAVAARRRGALQRASGEDSAAEDSFTEAARTIARLRVAAPDHSDVVTEDARLHLERARLVARRGDVDSAWGKLQAATNLLTESGANPEAAATKQLLAAVLGESAEVLSELGKADEAVAAAERAATLHEQLAAESPDLPESVEGAAESAIRWANASRAIGRAIDELRAYRAALRGYQSLVQARPEIARYRANLAVAQNDLAQLWQTLGENQQAKQAADEAIAGFSYLIDHHPPDAVYYEGLAVAEITLGRALLSLGEDEKSEAQFTAAIRVYQELLIPNQTTDTAARRGLGLGRANLGRLRQRQQKWPEAREQFQRALADFEAALAADSTPENDPVTHDAIAWTKTQLAECLWRSQEQAAASSTFAEAIALRENLPKNAAYLANQARLLANCDDPARRDPDRAFQLAGQAAAQTPENDRYRFLQALARYRSGRWDESERIAREVIQSRPVPNANDELLLAMGAWQLKKTDEARRLLAEAVGTRFARENVGSVDFQRLLQEARELIQP